MTPVGKLVVKQAMQQMPFRREYSQLQCHRNSASLRAQMISSVVSACRAGEGEGLGMNFNGACSPRKPQLGKVAVEWRRGADRADNPATTGRYRHFQPRKRARGCRGRASPALRAIRGCVLVRCTEPLSGTGTIPWLLSAAVDHLELLPKVCLPVQVLLVCGREPGRHMGGACLFAQRGGTGGKRERCFRAKDRPANVVRDRPNPRALARKSQAGKSVGEGRPSIETRARFQGPCPVEQAGQSSVIVGGRRSK